MKNVLFASTALAALAIGGAASAQGLTMFGSARLGLGYNINNNGSANGDEDVRAVSRVRWGVNMAGETDSGISFGATIRADNAGGGGTGPTSSTGQIDGNVFVSGSWGTLTFGDTAGADENWVGDIPGNLSLTGLGDLNETFFISNGGSFGSDVGNSFAANPAARPTVRYDFDIMGFGISVSSNRDLSDVGVGAGYAGEFANGTWNIAVGYYDYSSFDTVQDVDSVGACFFDDPNDPTLDTIRPQGNGCNADESALLIPAVGISTTIPSGTQWSGSVGGSYGDFGMGLVYTNADSDGNRFVDGSSFDTIGVGGTYGWEALTVGAYYVKILNADGEIEAFDGEQTYGFTAAYDLGGGAEVAGGIASTFGRGSAFGNRDLGDAETVGDFGIRMNF